MTKETLKSLSLISAIFGIILGIAGIIPFINAIALFAIFALTGVTSIIQYIMTIKQNETTIHQIILISASGGFISALCASIIFFPLVLIFNIYGFTSLFEGINLFIIIFIAFFFSLICAMTNAFVGSLFGYIYYNFIKK